MQEVSEKVKQIGEQQVELYKLHQQQHERIKLLFGLIDDLRLHFFFFVCAYALSGSSVEKLTVAVDHLTSSFISVSDSNLSQCEPQSFVQRFLDARSSNDLECLQNLFRDMKESEFESISEQHLDIFIEVCILNLEQNNRFPVEVIAFLDGATSRFPEFFVRKCMRDVNEFFYRKLSSILITCPHEKEVASKVAELKLFFRNHV